MNDVSRDEVNAKLESVEARVDTKLAIIDSKLDRIGNQITNAVQRLSTEGAATKAAAERAEARADEARSAATSMKWKILFTALGVVAVLVAFWAIWQKANSPTISDRAVQTSSLSPAGVLLQRHRHPSLSRCSNGATSWKDTTTFDEPLRVFTRSSQRRRRALT